MTQAIGLLKRAVPVAVSAYRRVVRVLESLIPVFDLSVTQQEDVCWRRDADPDYPRNGAWTG